MEDLTVKKVKESRLNILEDNPRLISTEKFNKLKQSIKEFPEMMRLRPIIVDEKNVVLGGNMRLKACRELGMKQVYVVKTKYLSEAQKREFIIKDNVGFGSWDYDILANNWDEDVLTEWGMDVWTQTGIENTENEEKYTKKFEVSKYEPSEEPEEITGLCDLTKYNELVEAINKTKLPKEVKEFLKHGATRHIRFDYSKIANFYAQSDKETQEEMEKSALVIIDFDKAIENGYVDLSQKILDPKYKK